MSYAECLSVTFTASIFYYPDAYEIHLRILTIRKGTQSVLWKTSWI